MKKLDDLNVRFLFAVPRNYLSKDMKKYLEYKLAPGESRGIKKKFQNNQVGVIMLHSTKRITFASNFLGHEKCKSFESKLKIQKRYNDFHGGVDWFNGLLAKIRFPHRCSNVKFVLLYYYLAISLVNATTIWNSATQNNTPPKDFLKLIEKKLLA